MPRSWRNLRRFIEYLQEFGLELAIRFQRHTDVRISANDFDTHFPNRSQRAIALRTTHRLFALATGPLRPVLDLASGFFDASPELAVLGSAQVFLDHLWTAATFNSSQSSTGSHRAAKLL